MSSEEENKALVRRLYEVQTMGDLDALRELLAPDFVDHGITPGEVDPGPEGYIRWTHAIHYAYSDVRYIIEDQMAAEGDRVVSHVRIRRTHDRGEVVGFAPTGKEYVVEGIVIHRIEGGKIAEEWSEGGYVTPAELAQARLEQEIRERERIEQELRVARRIQQASLPKEVPTLEGWQIAPYYQPAREVGGDFYDFHLLSDGRLGWSWATPPARGCQQLW